MSVDFYVGHNIIFTIVFAVHMIIWAGYLTHILDTPKATVGRILFVIVMTVICVACFIQSAILL